MSSSETVLMISPTNGVGGGGFTFAVNFVCDEPDPNIVPGYVPDVAITIDASSLPYSFEYSPSP